MIMIQYGISLILIIILIITIYYFIKYLQNYKKLIMLLESSDKLVSELKNKKLIFMEAELLFKSIMKDLSHGCGQKSDQPPRKKT